MLPVERMRAAYEHCSTDKIPVYHSGFSSRMASAVLGREAYVGGGIQQWRESCALWDGEEAHRDFLARSRRDAYDLARALDMDLVRPSYWRLAEKPTRRIDEYTFLYGDPEGKWVVRSLDPRTELYQIVDQSPSASITIDDLDRQVEEMERATAEYRPVEEAFAATFDALAEFGGERAVPHMGISVGLPENDVVWLEATVVRPDLVSRYVGARAERMVRDVKFLADRGVQFFMGACDFAGNNGPFYSPKAYRDLVLPGVRRLTDVCHRCGAYYAFASDGNLWPVAEHLFGQSGVDGYFEIDRRAGMDLARLREAFPHLTLIGNVSSHSLHTGKQQEVIDETLSCLELAQRSGSLVVGCSNQVVAETPIDNLMAMLDTIARYR